jgi:hypothetical protein
MRVPPVYLAATLGIVVLVGGSVAYAHRRHVAAPPASTASVEISTSYWEDQIRELGGPAAYEAFGVSVAHENAGIQHGDAHIFGGALYAVEGLPGISVCDSRFTSGCFHEFIGHAIAEQGLPIVQQLDTDCGQNTGCQHGIGHGLVAYLGYSRGDLEKAVSICSGLPDGAQSLQGCLGGTFMEFNMRTMAQATTSAARATGTDLLAPCDWFAGVESRACYLYQPQWWSETLASGQYDFAAMGRLCDELSGDAKDLCFAGVGEMAPPAASYEAQATIHDCSEAASDLSARTFCLSGAGLVYAGTNQRDTANAICATLGDTAGATCLSYMDNSNRFDDL